MAEVATDLTKAIEDGERTVAEERMEVESEEAIPESNVSEAQNGDGVDRNGDAKRSREDDENGTDGENGVAAKKQKVEKSVEEERLEKLQESEEKEGVEGEGEVEGKISESVSLGPKRLSSSVEMFDYFYKLLHCWPPNLDINKYEWMVLLDLLKKGHLESDKKIGVGVRAFQVRYHPMWKSKCFFILRQDGSVDDFSFRKCVDHILPLPEEMKVKSGANKVLGGRDGRGGGHRRGGGGRRGGYGRGRGRRCMNDPGIKTFYDIGKLAFGHRGKNIVAMFMYLELYLVAIQYLILEGDNLNKLFPNTTIKLGRLRIEGQRCFILLTALLIWPTTWLRSFGLLAYVSFTGVVTSVVLVLCVFWVGAVEGVGFHQRGRLLNWSGIPITASIFAFSFCGHPVFPTLCTSMKDNKSFFKVLAVCFAVCALNYASIGILGYLMYGESVKSQVTLNLPVKKVSSKVAIYITLINPLTKYAIIIIPISGAIEDRFKVHNNRPFTLIVRTGLLISNLVVALAVPFFGYVIALTGAFSSVTAAITVPCICYLKISKAYKHFGLELVIIIGILMMGSLIGVLGTYISIRQIIHNL